MLFFAAIGVVLILGVAALISSYLIVYHHRWLFPLVVSSIASAALFVPYLWGISQWTTSFSTHAMHFAFGWFYELINAVWQGVSFFLPQGNTFVKFLEGGSPFRRSTGNQLTFNQLYFSLFLIGFPVSMAFMYVSPLSSVRSKDVWRSTIDTSQVQVWELGREQEKSISPLRLSLSRSERGLLGWMIVGFGVFVYFTAVLVLDVLFSGGG